MEALAARCEAIADRELRTDVLELLRLVLELHGGALEKMLRTAGEAPHPAALVAAWKREQDIAALVELHELEWPAVAAPAPPAGGNFVPLVALAGSKDRR
ncbi:MAG: hypothetical protein ACRD1Y_05280 [Terriglobales bacterium]